VSKSLLGRCLLIGAIMCGVAVVPAAAILAYTGYYMLVPRYSAVAEFERYKFNLRLDLYLTDDEALDSGRYLNVITSGAYARYMLAGWDWSHRSRTSIYRIDDNHVAALSPLGHDYIITLKPLDIAPVVSDPMVPDRSEQWQYLGAYDFYYPPGGRRKLRFFDAHLAECIPMGPDDPRSWSDKPRAAARQQSCPSPEHDID
jgi:hypothetical protein